VLQRSKDWRDRAGYVKPFYSSLYPRLAGIGREEPNLGGLKPSFPLSCHRGGKEIRTI